MTLLDNARPEEDPARMRDFVAILKTEPDEYLKHSVRRLAALWGPRSWSDALRLDKDFSEYAAAKDYGRIIAKILLLAWDAAVMGLAAIGGLLALKRWREFAPVIGVVLYASLIYGLVYGGARYRVPVLPLISILAVVSLEYAFNVLRWPSATRAESKPCVVS